MSACVPRTVPRTPASGSSGTVGLGAGSSAVGCGLTCGCSPGTSSVFSRTLRPPSSTSVRLAPVTPRAWVLSASPKMPCQSLNSDSVALPDFTRSLSTKASSLVYPLTLVPLASPANSAPNNTSSATVAGVTSPPRTARVAVPTPPPTAPDTAAVLAISSAALRVPISRARALPDVTKPFAPTPAVIIDGAYSPAVAYPGAYALAAATCGTNFCKPASASSPPATIPPIPPAIAPTGPPTASPPTPPAMAPRPDAAPLTSPAAAAASLILAGTSTASVFTNSSICLP